MLARRLTALIKFIMLKTSTYSYVHSTIQKTHDVRGLNCRSLPFESASSPLQHTLDATPSTAANGTSNSHPISPATSNSTIVLTSRNASNITSVLNSRNQTTKRVRPQLRRASKSSSIRRKLTTLSLALPNVGDRSAASTSLFNST